jgi:hypothetical protein
MTFITFQHWHAKEHPLFQWKDNDIWRMLEMFSRHWLKMVKLCRTGGLVELWAFGLAIWVWGPHKTPREINLVESAERLRVANESDWASYSILQILCKCIILYYITLHIQYLYYSTVRCIAHDQIWESVGSVLGSSGIWGSQSRSRERHRHRPPASVFSRDSCHDSIAYLVCCAFSWLWAMTLVQNNAKSTNAKVHYRTG